MEYASREILIREAAAVGVPIPPADSVSVKYALAISDFNLALGQWMRRFKRLNVFRRQCERQRDGIFLHVRSGTGFRNRNDVTVADSPGQSHGRRRAAMRRTDTSQSRITQQVGARSAERRIGHNRHAVLLTPWQHAALNAAVADTVRELIGRAAIALRNTEEVLHVTDREIGNSPGANLACRAQFLKHGHGVRDVGDAIRPMQEIKIEMIGAEALETRFTGARNAIAGHVVGPHLGHEKNAIALTGNRATYEFLRAVNLRRVDQRHPERKAGA